MKWYKKLFSKIFSEQSLAKSASGIPLHICDIFVQELNKVDSEISLENMADLLHPFLLALGQIPNKEVKERIGDNIFKPLLENNKTIRETSDDEEILRAIYDTHRTGFFLLYIGEMQYPKLYLNVNLPDDLIDCYINSAFFLIEDLSEKSDRLKSMLKVGFNSTVNEKIQRLIDEIVIIKRKKKEDKTKDKLKAFLITASATQSVLKGNFVDDVVDASITEDVDDDVLDYMNKLLGKVK